MRAFLLTLALGLSGLGWSQTFQWDTPATQAPPTNKSAPTLTGLATVYPDYFHGSPTASGEVHDNAQFTGAHPKLPFGTMVTVTRMDNGQNVTVRINDRGSYCDECAIDLSLAAAQQIGLAIGSRAKVTLEITDTPVSNVNNEQLTARTGVVSPNVSNEQEQPKLTARGGDAVNEYDYVPATEAISDEEQREIVVQNCIVKPPHTFNTNDHNTAITNKNGVQTLNAPISPYTVQFGSYANYQNAERHYQHLVEMEFLDVFMMNDTANGRPLYRIVVAPFKDVEEAQDYIDEIWDDYAMEALILKTGVVEMSSSK